ncbi:hypothetical protein F4776DRAFT_641951 [Hypoxylon sp. NC0597]|nr:hypothetical protein F4776DRAFT_641951 [Hypoxylon sp. NC0597]
MAATPFGAVVGLLMILCLSDCEGHDPVYNMFALVANAAAAMCVDSHYGGGLPQELYGIALMGACRGSCGQMHPAGHIVAAVMLAHKLVTMDERGLVLDMVAALCLYVVPASYFARLFLGAVRVAL